MSGFLKYVILAGLTLPIAGSVFAQQPEQPKAKPAETKPAPAVAQEGKRPANRLAKETSPYLLLHAHNPVDWYPWGEEALTKAKKEGKLIFLSVGYSSCHWCHVMERESFLDDEIAQLLNKHFVCIKVDREERPDLDSIYMTALQTYSLATTGRRGGGWPMSIFLTPETQPFFGATYLPARDGDREGISGFLTVLKRVIEAWEKTPERIKQDAQSLTDLVKAELESRRTISLAPLEIKLYDAVQPALAEQFDAKWGGFGYDEITWQRPKFPEPPNLIYLLDHIRRKDDARSKEMLTLTLERMMRGGIYDHVGGGFHRYSVDRMWRIPHFEKMLYDNGQLASVYAEAGELLKRPDFSRVADETCDFVLREMTSPAGGFYAALDAESEGEEGKFQRWTKEELQKSLTAEEFELVGAMFALQKDPNFEEHYYVLNLGQPNSELATERKISEEELNKNWTAIRQKLLAVRDKRAKPLTDIKILAADNGLMIAGLADTGRLLKKPRYIEAAKQAADFALTRLVTKEGRLQRSYASGEAKFNAYLNDYAYLTYGLLALHRATGEDRWLQAAKDLTAKQIELFADPRGGGFFFTSKDHETLLARGKDPIDGANPAGNSIAAGNLIALAKLTNQPDWLILAEKSIQSAAGLIEQAPSAAPWMAVNIPALLAARAEAPAK
ncbi:hypothetical protein ETAA8_24010 [Anatilimnocola aggregata]|uniref:Spermatogenesis-associated protein 20-like TRX domain-containing protein n=1 Tax=Anatilimnocola aggregata TaxID=2528021 RepID=A0A517YAR6_9BACT|nr:thioredoxin domain-containing protein [Anatilimnocola aggregata]QDU27314.1 hypothetical protein ETAA8_24010 [Anatilimnocola aggregata]